MHEITAEQRTIYLRGLLQRYGTLSLPLGTGLSFSLIQVFQPLRLRQRASNEEKQSEHDDEETQHATREEAGEQDETEEHKEQAELLVENGLEALNKSPSRRMVILGGPGTGKTTVLKHLLCHHIQLALEDITVPLPVFLSLPDLARAGQNLDAYLAQIARDMGLQAAYGQAISSAIQQGHAFVCLDSLDEVLPRLRVGIIRQVNMLVQRDGNTWIVGSRFTDYKGGQFQQGLFQEWELQALDEPRRLQLAMQLLPELQRQLPSPNQPANMLYPHDYVQALSTHRQAATWGENPLLFSLGAVVYLRRGNLSGSRAMLYREVIDALLETREGETHQREQLRNILAGTALELYQARGHTFSADDLRATLTRLDTKQHAAWSIEDTLYRVLNSGMLDVVAYETYSFHHSTFQEYLTASALAQRFMSNDGQVRDAAQRLAWSKHAYSRWSEIECLLVGILVQEYGTAGTLRARAWLERLLQQQASSAGDPGNLSLELAIKALSEVAALVEWQAAKTLELEVMAATRWISRLNWLNKLFYTKRRRQQELLALAPEIGHLRPAAQHAAIDGILSGSYYNIGPTLGAMRSPIAAERMRTAWQNISNPCSAFFYTFTLLGEYAPVDLLFPVLQTPSADLAVKILKTLGRYTPVNELISLLGDASQSVRQQAADVLCVIASDVVLPTEPLLSFLQQEQVFAFPAVRVLARLQHPAAIEPAIAALANPDWQTRQDAVQALGCFKTPPLTDTILPLLNDTDYSVRKAVVEALGSLGPDAPTDSLLAALQDADEEVRMAAVQALGHMETQASLSALVAMLQDADSEVVTTTLQVLGKMGNRAPITNLLDMLHHHHSDVIHQAIKTLGEPHIIERVPIEPLLQFYHEHWHTRSTMLKTLGKATERLPSLFLIDALNDGYYDTDIIAAQLLGREKRQDSDEALLDEISAHAWQLRGHAVKILAAYSAEDYLAYLFHALVDETLQVSKMAAEELGKIADHIPIGALAEALQHAFPWVRTHALAILAKRTSPPPPEILSTALRDPHEQVRAAAASAAGSWTANAPIEQLISVTTDRFENVRFAAARSLGKVGLNDPVKALQGLLNVLCYPGFMEDPNDYRSINLVYEALSIIAPHAPVEPLYQAMHDLHKRKDDWLARTAASVLGEQGARAPIAQLVSVLHNQDANMRMLAVIALGKAGAHAPIKELIQALDNPPFVRAEVLRVLCALSATVPGDLFLQLLRNEKQKHHNFLGLLLALKNTGVPIPSDLLLQALQSNELWPPPMAEELISYLCSLNPLPLPTPTLIAGLATFLAHYQPSEAAVEKLRAALLPRLPLRALLATLAQRNATIRRGGLILLSYVPGNVPLKPLLAALRDPSPGVRQAAIYCIQVHTDRLPVSPLSALLQDGNTDVRKSAIKALAAAGADASINDLVTLLDDTDYNVQWAAIETLCQPAIARITPVEVFVRAMEFATVEGHSNAKVHKMALQVLCDKDPHIAITHSIAALGDRNAEIALTAFQVLQKISPATIPEVLQEATALLEGGKPKHFFRTLSMSFLASVIGDMGQATPDLIARLGELLNWPYWEVRMKAAQALGKLRRNIPDATIRRLLELRLEPNSRAVREAADEALAEILSLETGIEDD